MKEFESLKENNFQFKKMFGQNFISDTNLLNAIALDAEVNENDEVLEIGAGAGTLTAVLQQKAKKVVAVEIDKDLTGILQNKFKNCLNVEFIFSDILKIQDEVIKSKFKSKFKIVANLPYYITTPIIFKFLEGDFNLASITVMVQKEVAQRFIAKPGSKDYGIISVKFDAVGETKVCRQVSRKMFTPEPNVDSAIVKLTIKDKNLGIINKDIFNKTVDAAFKMRRKTLLNNLMSAFNLTRDKCETILKATNLNINIRGEALNTAQFVALSNELTKN